MVAKDIIVFVSYSNTILQRYYHISISKNVLQVNARKNNGKRTSSQIPGAGCSKLTTVLVNVSLKFQMLISQIRQYFLFKKCEKLLQCKSFSHFFNKKFQCVWL